MRIAKATADELAKRNSFMMTQRDLANFFGYAYDSRAVRHLVALSTASKKIEGALSEPIERAITIEFGKVGENFSSVLHRFSACFRAREFDPTGEFDPKAWNVYEGVQPPTGTWLAVEWKDDDDVTHGARAMYLFDKESCGWWFFDDDEEPLPREARVILFKLWDADE